jgi:hypothetical protein
VSDAGPGWGYRPGLMACGGPRLQTQAGLSSSLRRFELPAFTNPDECPLKLAAPPRPYSRLRTLPCTSFEAGRDALFVQQQVGHEHASTTSLYTCVSSDFRTRSLRRALDDTLVAAADSTRRTR